MNEQQLNQFQEAIRTSEEYRDIDASRVNDWYQSRISIAAEDCLTDEEIVEIINNKGNRDVDNSMDDEDVPSVEEATCSSEALIATNTLIKYCKENIMSKEMLLMLYSLKEKIIYKENVN